MKIIIGERGSGASTDLLRQACAYGGIYICPSIVRKNQLEHLYNNMENSKEKIIFISIQNILEKDIENFSEKNYNIYIDDIETILKMCLSKHKIPVDTITIGTTW